MVGCKEGAPPARAKPYFSDEHKRLKVKTFSKTENERLESLFTCYCKIVVEVYVSARTEQKHSKTKALIGRRQGR